MIENTLFLKIRYPYADSISKSQLKSVGSTYTWPMILGILIWMVELIMVYIYYINFILSFFLCYILLINNYFFI